MDSHFIVRWNKQKWEFKTNDSTAYTNNKFTYYGKVEKVFFLVKWNRQDDTYSIAWDDMTHTGSAWFSSTIAEAIQTIMADRAEFTMYERWRKNYPTFKGFTPTQLFVGNARINVVRFNDNSRWWYEAKSESQEDAEWKSKFFKSDVEPSKDHLLKQMIKGDFTLVAATEEENNDVRTT